MAKKRKKAKKKSGWARGRHHAQRVFILLLRCPECGKVFFRRRDNARTIGEDDDGRIMQAVDCHYCGAEVAVPPAPQMRGVRMLCKCGRKWRYLTNITDGWLEHACRDCGAPMFAVYNPGKNCYYAEGE